MSSNNQQDSAKSHTASCENSQSHNGMCQTVTTTNPHREQCNVDYPLNSLIAENETATDENSNAQMILDASPNKSTQRLDKNNEKSDKNEIRKTIKDIDNTNNAIIVVDNDLDKSPEQQLVSSESLIAISAINIKQEPISSHYDLDLRPFARGKFAQVKRCVHKDSQQEYAAKCIKKRRRLVDIRHEIMHEIQVLSLANVTNRIVKLHDVYETSNEIILVLEMAEGGELQRVLDDEEAIDEVHVQRMVKQILEGLFYLHKHDIAHLDIKPQNLLLTKKFPDGDIKLCDFGISRHIKKGAEIREICGTPDYVAPEILRYDPISLATDMWSLGVLTYALLSGYSPFGNENKQLTYCNITTANLDFPNECFSNVSNDAIDFIQKLVVREPAERLSCREALEHRWLKSVLN